MAPLGLIGVLVVLAGVIVLALLIALGVTALALGEREERGIVIGVIAMGGLLLLCCGTGLGLLWFLALR